MPACGELLTAAFQIRRSPLPSFRHSYWRPRVHCSEQSDGYAAGGEGSSQTAGGACPIGSVQLTSHHETCSCICLHLPHSECTSASSSIYEPSIPLLQDPPPRHSQDFHPQVFTEQSEGGIGDPHEKRGGVISENRPQQVTAPGYRTLGPLSSSHLATWSCPNSWFLRAFVGPDDTKQGMQAHGEDGAISRVPVWLGLF